MAKIWEVILKNWKTTLGGILIFIATVLWQAGYISQEVFTMISSALVALGFIAAKDGNKTGV